MQAAVAFRSASIYGKILRLFLYATLGDLGTNGLFFSRRVGIGQRYERRSRVKEKLFAPVTVENTGTGNRVGKKSLWYPGYLYAVSTDEGQTRNNLVPRVSHLPAPWERG